MKQKRKRWRLCNMAKPVVKTRSRMHKSQRKKSAMMRVNSILLWEMSGPRRQKHKQLSWRRGRPRARLPQR